jgi:hypothetical protein
MHDESFASEKTASTVKSVGSLVVTAVAFCNTTIRWRGKMLRPPPSHHAEDSDQATPR